MALYAIGDTHLSLSSDKPMDVFGGGWTGYVEKLREGLSVLEPGDTVVLCGDLSWGMSLAEERKYPRRASSWRSASSEKSFLTPVWASSKLPKTEQTPTFFPSWVTI